MYYRWFRSVLVFTVSLYVVSAASFQSLTKRGMYSFATGISIPQHVVMSRAYGDAIFLALNALNPPSSITASQQTRIFEKYFLPGTRSTVEAVYRRVVGSDTHGGSSSFSDLTVDANDGNGVCEFADDNKFIQLDGTIITVCPKFWAYLGFLPPKACSDLAQDIVSWQMVFPGAAILHLFVVSVGMGAIGNGDIIDWGIPENQDSGPNYTSAEYASNIRQHEPRKAVFSATNYDWYALELYWTGKCKRSFRLPENKIEDMSGKCYGLHCAAN